jgi:soluble lytic murein transglycosylase-like protein
MAIPTPSPQAPVRSEHETPSPEKTPETQANASGRRETWPAQKNSWSARELRKLFTKTAKEYKLPANLLMAVAQHESRSKPWALNLNGQSFFPESRAEAIDLLRDRGSDNFDLGIMQVNSQWLDDFGLTPEQALAPDANIRLGACILKQCVDRYGLSWDALSAYHTGKSGKHNWRASVYALRVWGRYEKLQKAQPERAASP